MKKNIFINIKPKNDQNNKDLNPTSSTINDINDDKAISTSSKSTKSAEIKNKEAKGKDQESTRIVITLQNILLEVKVFGCTSQ